jgi:hypothetical protein
MAARFHDTRKLVCLKIAAAQRGLGFFQLAIIPGAGMINPSISAACGIGE